MKGTSREFLAAYVDALDALPGWFSLDAAAMFIAYNQLIAGAGIRGDVLEIGVYHGKSAILLGALRGPYRRFVAADLFDSMQSFGATNDASHLGMKAAFLRNLQEFHDDVAFIRVISGSSAALHADDLGREFSFCHIDGDHSAHQTYQDMELCAEILMPGGILAMDDYLNPLFPGVSEASARFSIEHAEVLIPIAIGFNKAVFQKAPAPFDLKMKFAEEFSYLPRHSTFLWERPAHLFLTSLGPFTDLEHSSATALKPRGELILKASIHPELDSVMVAPGETLNLPVEVANHSSIEFNWGIALSYHLSRDTGQVLSWDNGRYVFEPPMSPGEQRIVNVGLMAPSDPGRYCLEMDIVWDGVTWFKDRGSRTAVVQLSVS